MAPENAAAAAETNTQAAPAPAGGNGSGTSGGSMGGAEGASPATSPTTPIPVAPPASASEALTRASAALDAQSQTTPSGQATGRPGAAGSATATAPPAGQPPIPTSATAATQGRGEAPQSRIEAAVRNARASERTQVLSELGGSLEDVQHAVSWMHKLRQDPHSFLRQLMSELHIEQGVGDGREEEEQDLIDPEPDLRSQDGTKTAYSAEAVRQLVSNIEQRLTRQFMGHVQPAMEFTRRAAEEAQTREITQAGERSANQALSQIRQLPHFKDNEAAIKSIYAAIPADTRREVGSIAALYMAYNHFMAESVLPSLQSSIEAQHTAHLQRAAAAGATTVLPGATLTAKPVIREGNVDDLASHMRKLAAASA